MKDEITKDTMISDIITDYPEAVPILNDHGMQCVGCAVATWETLEQAAQEHKINTNELIQEINNKIRGGLE